MKLVACAVYDVRAGAYMTPFFVQSKGIAIRSFEAACRKPDSAFAQFPNDYTLFYVGDYDDSKASFENAAPVPVPLASAIEFTSKETI